MHVVPDKSVLFIMVKVMTTSRRYITICYRSVPDPVLPIYARAGFPPLLPGGVPRSVFRVQPLVCMETGPTA